MPSAATPASSIVKVFGAALTVFTTLLRSPTIPTNITRFEINGRSVLEMTLDGPVEYRVKSPLGEEHKHF